MSFGSEVSVELSELETEQRCPLTTMMDTLGTSSLLELLHKHSLNAFTAVQTVLPQLTVLVDEIVDRLSSGGRLFYVGAGTSGRLGVLDASECPPTFGVDPTLVQGIIAGGTKALTQAIEGAEDQPDLGSQTVDEYGITDRDVVIGLASSGRTPFVIGALIRAREIGAYTSAVVNVSKSPLSSIVHIILHAVTGPEALTGSTRLNAGTAQKLILNLITTCTMIKLGKVYENLMVDVHATNYKLKDRAARIVKEASQTDLNSAMEALFKANGDCKTAIVMIINNTSEEHAKELISKNAGNIRHAISSLPVK